MSEAPKRLSMEESEFMPVTKKLNSLRLDSTPESSSNDSAASLEGSSQAATVAGVPYNPALSRQQNPIYYEPNRVLYEAYVLRTKRTQGSG